MKVVTLLLSLGIIFLFTSCVSVSAIYKPPNDNPQQENYSRIINKDFDKTWNDLINYSANTFFGIDNFEKQSGLITLSFGASNPEDYITGGYWKVDYRQGMNQMSFEGDYVEYLCTYQNGKLIGKMNIVVSKIDEDNTKVTVNARYVFNSDIVDVNGYRYSNTWTFNSGQCDEIAVSNKTKDTPPTRTLCSTYKAEKAILTALEGQ